MLLLTSIILYLVWTITAIPLYDSDILSLEDVFISVKTTGKFHKSRLEPVLDTWYNLSPTSVWFFTDTEDDWVFRRLSSGGHLIQTNCPSDHSRQSLCCKMEAEIKTFLLDTKRKWFCHVDDDNYLNVPALTRKLAQYQADEDWYLGKVSISKPLQIFDKAQQKEVEFFFGTGGAGFCLSRSLAEKIGDMSESLSETGNRIGLPDDVTVGYLATVLLGVPLTEVNTFHSHLEALSRVDTSKSILEEQLTFSYGVYEDGTENHVRLPVLDVTIDPTTMYSLHCALFGKCTANNLRRIDP